jgi:F-type H+-transporting ATPase subunit gamma
VKRHPLMTERPVKRVLTSVIAGDRGMAGGYNSNVLRAFGRRLRERKLDDNAAIAIGRRASSGLARARDVKEIASFDVDVEDTYTGIVLPVLEQTFRMFEAGEIDAVDLVSTDFVSTVTQKVDVRQMLPVVVPEKTTPKGDAEMEPEAEDLVDFAIRRVLEAELTQAILESRASEQAARMLAMMNATDNADDIISDLTLVYNNERQSGITQEISEITGGAEAITKA